MPAGPSTVSPSKSPSRSRSSITSGRLSMRGIPGRGGIFPVVWTLPAAPQKRFPVLAFIILLDPGVDRLRRNAAVGILLPHPTRDLFRRPFLRQPRTDGLVDSGSSILRTRGRSRRRRWASRWACAAWYSPSVRLRCNSRLIVDGNAPQVVRFPSERLPDAAIALCDHALPV